MRYFIIISVFIFLFNTQAKSQQIQGKIMEETEKGTVPLQGANIFWLGTTTGTSSNADGYFTITKDNKEKYLVISYTGYKSDTIFVKTQLEINVVLSSSVDLQEVDITSHARTSNIAYMSTFKVEKIGEGELQKAACCNLSESFETNPSVDVSFTDAVTGTRQIQMLGLAGPYTQITRENMPNIRGLSAIYGLTYTPGTWISNINLIKGTGSVLNGYESIAGQIDVDLWKPINMDKFYLNLFANMEGRLEANTNLLFDVGKGWKTSFLLHAKTNQLRNDYNNDGFMDGPIATNLIGMNRWVKKLDNGNMQVAVKVTYIDQTGGQMDYEKGLDQTAQQIWGMENQTKRFEAWLKRGVIFKKKRYQSIGFQASGVYHDQHNIFGLTDYKATQKSFYANLIFQSIIGNTNHKYKLGSSFVYDDYQQQLKQDNWNHTEIIPGIFAEYTYNWNDRLNLVAGIRGDYHNTYGFFATPRLHLRYLLSEDLVVRVSAGRGQRTAQIISENMGVLASSRIFEVHSENTNTPYGLDAEVAWNYGINLTWDFELDYREGTISTDFYRTNFQNQIVVDLDSDVRKVMFYNLDGESYSNSFQVQFDYELIKRLDVRLAYRWFDVHTTYGNELMQKPLVSSHRSFINLAYNSRAFWKFDATLNWQGEKRIPSTIDNPLPYQRDDYSPSFFMLNAQITKSWKGKFDVYLGAENLLNYKQNNPIIASDQPFSEYFDASLVWGPIFGRKVYIGLRYRLK